MAKNKKDEAGKTVDLAGAVLRVEMWPVSRLRLYEKNPRKNDKAVPRMVKTITDFGWVYPILARSSGEIVDGHLRFKAALKMGLTEAPVSTVDHLSDGQIRALRLAVNKSAEWAEWDAALLSGELETLEQVGVADMAGFTEQEVDLILGKLHKTELKEKEVALRPFKTGHILISFKPEDLILFQDKITEIAESAEVEIEYGAN